MPGMLALVALATCLPCHAAIVESFGKTGMGRSFFPMTKAQAVEDFAANNRFFHEPSQSWFTLLEREGRYFQRREHVKAGIEEKEIHYVLGSGNHARSYVHRTPQGRLIALPVSWYGSFWQMAPGFDTPGHPHFGRRVTYDCFFCHNAYPKLPANADVSDPRYLDPLPEGIDCSRCHGGAGTHLQKPGRGNILNPARLPAARQLEVCLQCHLETTSQPLPFARRRAGREFFSYDPGEPLGDYMVHLDHEDKAPWNDKFEVVGAPYRLMQSPCFQKSEGRMTCTTCHNPHERPASSDTPCRSCHPRAHRAKPEAGQSCVACHMARRQPDDARLTIFTDHRISRRPDRRPGPELPAYKGRPRVYWPRGGVDDPAARVREDVLGPLRSMARERFPALAPIGDGLSRFPGDPFLLTLAGEAFRLRSRLAEAETYLRKAIAADPDQPEAYVNLGALLASQGKVDDAIALFRRAWAIDPKNEAARSNLERALRARQ